MSTFLQFSCRGLLVGFLLSLSVSLYSQGEVIELTDTSTYLYMLQGWDLKENLNQALMEAAVNGDTTSIRWLIRNGADVDATSVENISPLMFAIANNHKDAVRVILEYNPGINIESGYSETPLLIAVKNQNLEIAEMLIRDSADVNMADRFGATPLHYAAIYGYFYMVDMLLYYNAAVYMKSDDGVTPLMAAVWSGFPDIADLLIQNGANPEDRDNTGFTPFLLAAQNGDTLIMSMLLERNIDLYEHNIYRYNALDLSIKSNSTEAVEFLLRRGDMWNDSKNNAVNPFDVSLSYGRKEMIGLLEKYNIEKNRKAGFDQVSISASARLHFHDYYTGISIALKDPFLSAGIFTGCDLKPTYTRVLMQTGENEYYQYFDRRSVVYGGIFKEFIIKDNPLQGSLSMSGYLALAYSFGNKLKGTSVVPENNIKINPAIELNWNKNWITVFGRFEYLKTELFKVGPVWLRIGASYNLFFNKSRAPGKIIKWY